jgi:hypothetical protein
VRTAVDQVTGRTGQTAPPPQGMVEQESRLRMVRHVSDREGVAARTFQKLALNDGGAAVVTQVDDIGDRLAIVPPQHMGQGCEGHLGGWAGGLVPTPESESSLHARSAGSSRAQTLSGRIEHFDGE